MSVDLGHEFFKVALMRQGVPLEIVLNGHSKRKTPTAVSHFEAIRTCGDDAVAHMSKAPAKVPMFFHSSLGTNFTSTQDIVVGGAWWKTFGLSDKFYHFDLSYEEERGVPTFRITGDNVWQGEEVLAHILHFARVMAEESANGKSVRDIVVTVPSDANLRQRQAVVAAGEIAGLRVLTLVHETSAFAIQRAVDFTPEKGVSEVMLLYNMGSRKTEVSLVRFESRVAGMVAGKVAPVLTVLGSAVDYTIGGHLMDLKIAEKMLIQFQAKYPKLADGIAKNPRALRKLVAQAQKTKAMLSANKNAPFIVESLYDDTDFQTSITRVDFEAMCEDMLSRLTEPIEKALATANVSLEEVKHIELVGGAWRVPKVQQVLSDFFSKGEVKMTLGQHLNGEEAGALGATLVGANYSSSFRVKKIFFADITAHEYAVQVSTASGDRNLSVLYPVGAPLGGSKKKLGFALEEDFMIRLFEDSVLVAEYYFTGLAETLAGKWADYNKTGLPKISVSIGLEGSGIIEVTKPVATVEEAFWVNISKPKAVPNTTDGNETNATKESESSLETGDGSVDGSVDAGGDTTTDDNDGDEKPDSEEGSEGSDTDAGNSTGNGTNGTGNGTEKEVEMEIVYKLKKKKHEKKLTMKRVDYRPVPLSRDTIAVLRAKMEDKDQKEQEAKAADALKNELEAVIYGSRDKLENSDIIKVSTEEQREAVTKLLTEYEDWMYETGAVKSDYEERLTTLRNHMAPLEERALELEARYDLADTVKDSVEGMKRLASQIMKNMTWVNVTKPQAILEKLGELEEWWQKKQDQQAKLPLHEAPAFTKSEVSEKLGKLRKELDKLKKTKKPKETKAKGAKNATGDATKGSKEEEEMPADIEATEKKLAALRIKKSEAVEREDFDAAHKLKASEKALTEHLARLQAAKEEL
eukprot:CAMPEP_0170592806 /NCGR_PEP_ID=MMETSP0224-20130122/13116_1 /TAXON_ID=285029 /ORGANISM="Togula jolla, Strain CCCM 725" /LENGTH=918 /DNA_ID=CAMNT_0010916727 /DNA_START=198 /DNA_END=2954 /DNA_ORIENTATION=+